MAWGSINISGGSPEAWILNNKNKTKEMLDINVLENEISNTNSIATAAQQTASAAQADVANKAPSDIITAGTTDLTAGISALASGKFYAVY